MVKKPANNGKNWTKEDTEKLKDLANGNTPTRIIGLKLKRTESSVQAKAMQEKVSLNPPNQPPYDRKVSDAKKGKK
jgi:hypothetical protein